MPRNHLTAEQIDAILPQTQCGLCGYGGCMPYAEGLVRENAAIDLCPPGGVKGLQAIAKLVNEDPTPFIKSMEEKAKPRLLAIIREDECIGCTKCIQACPVDAILGSGKLMHTVIAAECTGCELCVAPCPVDCIDIVAIDDLSETEEQQKADAYRKRFQARNQRLAEKPEDTILKPIISHITSVAVDDKKAFIEAALLRAKMKKNQAM
jgi:electron transport complex protein RnfB